MSHTFPREVLRALVGAPSVSSHDAVKDQNPQVVLDVLAGFLSGAGANCKIHGNALRPQKPILVATFGDGVETGAVLAGHVDTVPAVSSEWSGDPWTLRERDGRWIGLGTTDMKGFFAAAIAALADLKGRLNKQVCIVATTDEESGMEGMRHLAQLHALPAAPTVIGEPTSGQIAAGSKGIYVLRLHIAGVDGHASQPPPTGRTIDAVRLLLNGLHDLEHDMRHRHDLTDARFSPACPTLNVGRLDVGDVSNRLAARGTVELEFRLLPALAGKQCNVWLDALIADVAARTGTQLRYDALFELPAFSNEAMGNDVPRMPYACEAGYFPDHSKVCIWGPGELSRAHTADESVDIAMLMQYRGDLTEWILKNCN